MLSLTSYQRKVQHHKRNIVKDKDLARAWTSICSKRGSCDNAISGQCLLEYLCFRGNLENIFKY